MTSAFRDFHHAQQRHAAALEALRDAQSPEGRELFAACVHNSALELEAIRQSMPKIEKVCTSPQLPIDEGERNALLLAEVHDEIERTFDAVQKAVPPAPALRQAPVAKGGQRAADGSASTAISRAPLSKQQRAFTQECQMMRNAILSSIVKHDSPALRRLASEIDTLTRDARSPADLIFRAIIPMMRRIAQIEDEGRQ